MTCRILFSPAAKRTRSALPRAALASETWVVKVGGKERLLVRREREIFRIATSVLLSGEFCRKIGNRFAGRGVEDRDLVAVGQGYEKPGVVTIEQKSGRMRAPGKRRSGLAKWNEAADTFLQEVQLRPRGSIPERDEASPAIACHN